MLDPHDALSEERQEQNQPLIQDLRRLHDTATEDSASLVRMRARLLHNTAQSLSVAHPAASDNNTHSQKKRSRRNDMQIIHTFSAQKPWQKGLSLLAAAILIALIVGSLVLAITRIQSTNMVSPPPPAPLALPKFQHGWRTVASFSGTGNKTITNVNVDVAEGQPFGIQIVCSQPARIQVMYEAGAVDNTCAPVTTSAPIVPGDSRTFPLNESIQTIEVTAAPSIRWRVVLLVQHPYLSSPTKDSGYEVLGPNIEGYGSRTVPSTITMPDIGEVRYVCYGTGTWTLQMGRLGGVTRNCDGQSESVIFNHTNTGTVVQQVQVTTAEDNDWEIQFLACKNPSLCGH